MSDSGRQYGDCPHARRPDACVECLRAERDAALRELDEAREQVDEARNLRHDAQVEWTKALIERDAALALLGRCDKLIDQLECLAQPEYPSLYGRAKGLRRELARLLKAADAPREEGS